MDKHIILAIFCSFIALFAITLVYIASRGTKELIEKERREAEAKKAREN